MKILITGGKSALALKLSKAFATHQVILADYGEVPHFASATFQVISLGIRNDDTLAHTLLNNCLDRDIDMLLPLGNFEVEQVAKAHVLFEEFNISVLLPSPHDCLKYAIAVVENHKDWAIFKAGDLLYSTVDGNELADYGRNELLNGAFFFEKNNGELILKLITIANP